MAFNIKIGTTDITDYIAFEGLKWSRNDVDSPNAGRTQDGYMHRGRVSTKIKLELSCRILTNSEHTTLMNLIKPETISVTYTDPMYGALTKTMYSNNNSSEYCMLKGTEEYWQNVKFSLVEV